jgi:hypothetical protein
MIALPLSMNYNKEGTRKKVLAELRFFVPLNGFAGDTKSNDRAFFRIINALVR